MVRRPIRRIDLLPEQQSATTQNFEVLTSVLWGDVSLKTLRGTVDRGSTERDGGPRLKLGLAALDHVIGRRIDYKE